MSADQTAIEDITLLKARYCRYLDTKRWDDWRQLFTDDFVSDTSASGGRLIEGADEFVDFTRRMLGKASQITVHQVHNPEIELTSATTASGVWALNDIVRLGPGLNLQGYGYYHESYVLGDDGWRIASSTLTRLREDLFNGLFSIRISDRLRAVMAGVARRMDT